MTLYVKKRQTKGGNETCNNSTTPTAATPTTTTPTNYFCNTNTDQTVCDPPLQAPRGDIADIGFCLLVGPYNYPTLNNSLLCDAAISAGVVTVGESLRLIAEQEA